MPRAKPIRNLTPRAASTPIKLTSADQDLLAEVLNLVEPRFTARRKRALGEVEDILLHHPLFVSQFSGPAAANVLEEIRPLLRSVEQTWRILSQLSRPAKNLICQAGSLDVAWGPFGDPPPEVQRTIDTNTLLLRRAQKDLPALVESLRLVKGSVEARPRKGPKKQWGLRLTALSLWACFKRNYRPNPPEEEGIARDEFVCFR